MTKDTAQKMKFSIKDFFNNWPNPQEPLMETFFFVQ